MGGKRPKPCLGEKRRAEANGSVQEKKREGRRGGAKNKSEGRGWKGSSKIVIWRPQRRKKAHGRGRVKHDEGGDWDQVGLETSGYHQET